MGVCDMASVKIYNGKAYINGTELRGIKAIRYDHVIGTEYPCIRFEVAGVPDVSLTDAYVNLIVTPENLPMACALVREAYKNDKDFYEAFLVGIKDVLDHSDGMDTAECAKRIGDRIVGER
jgi:hypothetical protein